MYLLLRRYRLTFTLANILIECDSAGAGTVALARTADGAV